jgi:hypothetical protein
MRTIAIDRAHQRQWFTHSKRTHAAQLSRLSASPRLARASAAALARRGDDACAHLSLRRVARAIPCLDARLERE